MENLDFGLTYAIPAAAAALAISVIGYSALNAVGRNPEKVNDIRTVMILAISFTDALAIIGLIAAIVARFI
jgi:F0F1-type ATP synthase membrane subunit c/vacuolar-type H+-ATPase subunit K